MTVDRFNLNSAPMEFVNSAVVNDFINDKGPDGLPVTVLDGKIILSGRYPTNVEFTEWLGLSDDLFGKQEMKAQPTQNDSDGCCKGGCC